MTLPFPEPSHKRIYTCFCCGREFDLIEDYKDHIIEEHEEGRDYILCPLKRCGMPVRDVPLHVRAHHKNEPIPKTGQLKALVWKDFGKKKNKKGKPQYKTGWYPSSKMNKKFKYRSGYEETVYQCLDAWQDVLAFEAEPFKIPYLFQGEAHKYTPDILVHFLDGHKEIWEIKPGGQTRLPKNEAKWHAAAEACKNRGWDFVVYTEKGINQLKNKIRIQDVQLNEED